VLKERNLLAKPTRDTVIRLAPPLVMTDHEMAKCTDILAGALKDVDTIDPSKLAQGH
jgi:ornithine--oxo-acid transaminase